MTLDQKKILELLENYIEYSKENGYNDFKTWCKDNIDTFGEQAIVDTISEDVNWIADNLFNYK